MFMLPLMPAGGLQHSRRRSRSASISLCESCALGAALGAPRLALLLSAAAVATWRCGARWSRSSAIWLALYLGVFGVGFSCGCGGCVFFNRSAIRSALNGAGFFSFFSAGFASGLGFS